MRILFISSEVAPFSKTGGLGDVAGALPRALAARGHEVRLVSPLYRSVPRGELQLFGEPLTLHFPFGNVDVRTWRTRRGAVEFVFVEAPAAFDREGLYGYGDDARRFAVAAVAALSVSQRDAFRPDVVHCNDWPTAPALLALRTGFAHTALARARRVFTIHNLAYQGNFPKHELEALGIPWTEFTVDGVEFYDQLSFMKMGIVSADVLTTVSPSYAKEIQTPAFGVGLDGLLRHRSAHLAGILNGVDTAEWNPATDVFLPARFTAAELSGRARCRSELLASVRLEAPVEHMPLFGVIGRMASQKGADLIQATLPRLLEQGASAVVLGAGEGAIEHAWKELAARFPRRLALRLGFDESLAHRIEAGADFFLMPSRFEPCGLNQMYSLLYGAVPVVHAVGGLRDTVRDIRHPDGNGVVFERPTAEAMFQALVRAVELFRDPARYLAVQRRGMNSDFGWERSAAEYERLYGANSH
ncbi:MAG: glycogen synthase GlgA [Myxococcota bacterium]